MTQKLSGFFERAWLWIIAFIAIYHFSLIFIFKGNYFWYDDLIVSFYEIERFFNSKGFLEGWRILAGPYGDHRSFVSRAFFTLQALLSGNEVRYDYLIIIGNLFMIPLLYFFIRHLRRSGENSKYGIVAASAILLTGQTFEAQFFANGVFCYLVVIAVSVWLLYETSYENRLWLMMIIGILALLTFGNALFAVLSVSVMLILKKNWKLLLGWIAFTVISFTLYFYRLDNPYSSKLNILEVLTFKGVKSTLMHIGSVFYFEGLASESLMMALGAILFITALAFIFLKSYRVFFRNEDISNGDIFIIGVLCLGLASSLSIGLLRGSTQLYMVFFSRYRFGPILLLLADVLIIFSLLKKTEFKAYFLTAILLLVYVPSQAVYTYAIREHFVSMNTHLRMLEKYKKETPKEFNPFNMDAKVNLTFNPETPITDLLNDFNKVSFETEIIPVEIVENSSFANVSIKTKIREFSVSRNVGDLLYLRSDSRDYVVSFKDAENIISQLMKSGENRSLFFDLDKSYYKKGTYNLYYIHYNRDTVKWYELNKNLIIE